MLTLGPKTIAALGVVIGLALLAATAVVTTPTLVAEEGEDSGELDYAENLAMIQESSIRNTNHDRSAWRDTPMDEIVIDNHLGPRSDYLDLPDGQLEQAFPTPEGGQFRVTCEFSHFAYDDPIVHPGQPGAAHLHMFWGNTDVNAHSSYDTLFNSGSSTCNGQELNRTGYWAPAMFDGDGNVRIPERIVVYYKGEGLANGASEAYPPGAAMIPSVDINTVSFDVGGSEGKFSFVCSDQWSGSESPQANTVPSCDGNRFFDEYGVVEDPYVVLEMNVKFPQCWNGQDASDPSNYSIPDAGSWYFSQCPTGWTTLPNLEYFINYRVEIGEDTADWYLSSDIDPQTFEMASEPGASIHADWWGAWHPEVNRMWLDNCVNFSLPNEATGCGMGYLTNGGPDGDNPFDGPALQFRPQYDGPSSVAATTVFAELCPTTRTIDSAQEAAYCNPAGHDHDTDHDHEPVDDTDDTDDTDTDHDEEDPDPVDVDPEPAVYRCGDFDATIIGTDGDDVIIGTRGDDVIWAGDGDDVVRSRGGNDVVCGGPGDDQIYGGPGFENLFGGEGNDVLYGGADDDWLFGEEGDDKLFGNAGSDELHSFEGDDVLRGGRGDDLLFSWLGIDELRGGGGTDSCGRLPGDVGRNWSCEIDEVLD